MQFSLFTSGSKLSKTFSLGQKGELVETPGGRMAKGSVKVIEVEYLEQMKNLIAGLNGTHALSFGVPVGLKESIILSEDNAGKVEGAISRTRKNFAWPDGPGVFMVDYDAPKDGTPRMTRDQLLAALNSSCPALAHAPTLVGHSASTHLYHGDRLLKGDGGFRVYYAVKDAKDIPRAGEVLFKRLWLAGFGRIEISQGPSMLVKSPADRSVWGPEKLDFAGGASCVEPIVQKRPEPLLLNDDFDTEPLDTRRDLPDLTPEEEATFADMVANAKTLAEPALEAAIEKKIDETLAKEGKSRDTDPDAASSLRNKFRQAGLPLTLDTELLHHSGATITIRECLADPGTWDNEYFRDPYDHEYGGNNHRIAQLHLDDPINVYSFAHGGTTYYLDMRPEDEFTPVPQEEPAAQQDDVYHFLKRDQIMALPDLDWYIKGIFPARGLAVVSGASKAGKSFLALDAMCAVVEGREWFGHRTKQTECRYIVLEGEGGLKQRVLAWEKKYGRPLPTGVEPFFPTTEEPFNLLKDARKMARSVPKHSIIVIDTLNRAAPAAEENTSKDMGLIIAAAKLMESLTEGLVILVAHEGKDSSRGIRGHSSLFAALDANITCRKEADGTYVWSIEKAKDGRDGDTYGYELQVFDVGVDKDGDKITSCAIEPRPDKIRKKLTKTEAEAYKAWIAAATDNCAHESEWKRAMKDADPEASTGTIKKRFARMKKRLVEKGYLIENDGYYRPAGGDVAEDFEVVEDDE